MSIREQSLTLVRNYVENYRRIEEFVCELASKFRIRYDELQAEQSLHYHINIIEELHINENGHSRVLCKLLQYKDSDGRYVFLESLLREIVKIKPAFSVIKISAPIITQEKKRIDLWVRDKDYAIIFENKVYNAVDQDTQIYRYITETKNEGFSPDQIFIVYMPETEKEPDKGSVGNVNENYEEIFAERYVCFPFKEKISKWVKDTLESKTIEWENETILHSALLQYSHFLDILYNKQETNMLLSLESVIINSLSPDFEKNKPIEQIKILGDCISVLESLASVNDVALAQSLEKNDAVLESLRTRLNKLTDKYILNLCKAKSLEFVENHPGLLREIHNRYITLALPPFKGISDELTLSMYTATSNTYIQLTSRSGRFDETSEFNHLKNSNDFTQSNQWHYWKVVDFSPSNVETVVDDYETILKKILETEYWKD